MAAWQKTYSLKNPDCQALFGHFLARLCTLLWMLGGMPIGARGFEQAVNATSQAISPVAQALSSSAQVLIPEALAFQNQKSLYPAEDNFFISTLEGLKEVTLSPARLRWQDGAWLLPLGAGLGVLLNNDVPLYHLFVKEPWLDASMPWVTDVGEGWVDAVLVGSGWLFGREDFRKTSALAEQGLAEVGIFSLVFKELFSSNRPSQNDQAHQFFDYGLGNPGFPSGHSMDAFCLAEIYGSVYGRVWTYPLAALVGYSRIYLGAHWASDVLAGSALGILIGHLAVEQGRRQGAPTLLFFSSSLGVPMALLSWRY